MKTEKNEIFRNSSAGKPNPVLISAYYPIADSAQIFSVPSTPIDNIICLWLFLRKEFALVGACGGSKHIHHCTQRYFSSELYVSVIYGDPDHKTVKPTPILIYQLKLLCLITYPGYQR